MKKLVNLPPVPIPSQEEITSEEQEHKIAENISVENKENNLVFHNYPKPLPQPQPKKISKENDTIPNKPLPQPQPKKSKILLLFM